MDILTSIHGKRLGIAPTGELVVGGPGLIVNNDGAAPFRMGGAGAVAGGAALTLTRESHGGKTILWDTAAGTTITLPAALGTGAVFRCLVSVLATSNSHIVKVANATDVFRGLILGSRVDSGNAVLGFATAADSDTITLNRTTTGSVSLGEWVEIEDFAAGFFLVRGVLSATGAAFATPFSAGV